MLATFTRRPRNVDVPRAAGILYGDWGTSKAYVIGLAFAISGYSSFWLIAAVSIFSILIALNYIVICKYYPNGGGVYASVRHRSQWLSLVGAFFLIADYGVTAAISAVSAFQYLGVPEPVLFAAGAMMLIGLLNTLGPHHTGKVAFIIGIITVAVLLVLALFSLPHLLSGWRALQPLPRDNLLNWSHFVTVIVALSGIEAIANATGVMRLDRGTTTMHPSVKKTSTPAILIVMIEVAVLTTLFSLALTAIPGLELRNDSVFTAHGEEIRDHVLRFLGQTFLSGILGPTFGYLFGLIISIIVALLLLSAVNTAVIGLISILYLMANDNELPRPFQKLNRYGVPYLSCFIATILPFALILIFKDIAKLADLYAIGFVGAIATNLGSTSTDFSLPLRRNERGIMIFTFLIMAAIEITLFAEKPHARNYVLAITALGLILRTVTHKPKEERKVVPLVKVPVAPGEPALLCLAKRMGKTVSFALEKAERLKCPLYLLFVREQKTLSEKDAEKTWVEDREATRFFNAVLKKIPEGANVHFCYIATDAPANSIVEYAIQLEVTQVIMSLPKGALFQLVRGNLLRDLSNGLPPEIQFVVIP